jgi:hypothetical protein
MARLRLQTQLLISTLLIICALTGSILFIIRNMVLKQIDGQVRDSADVSVREFENVQQQLQIQLSRTAALLAEIPTLKALMTTRDAPTIQDGSMSFWNLAGSDLFLLADPAGRVVALDLPPARFGREDAENYVRASLREGHESAWWYAGGRLYWVFLRPISAGSGSNSRVLGFLAVGYEMNSGSPRSSAWSREARSSSRRRIKSLHPRFLRKK